MIPARSVRILLILVLAALVGASFLFGGPRSLVDWRGARVVALESDDWGLAGFVPAADSWEGLDRSLLDTGRFPEVYWLSTLESAAQVRSLNEVLARYRGEDGRPAVMQPNYITSSLEYLEGEWLAHDLPDLPAAYQRPGLWDEVREAIGQGTWYPELHGAWHYDPEKRKQAAAADDLAREITARGIMLFPGSERARELGPWRSVEELGAELDHSLGVFAGLFGRQPETVIAPDYNWSGRMEKLWASRGLRVIQAKREQINPAWDGGLKGRLAKYLSRQWDQWVHPERTYLERNCRLETGQAADAVQVVAACAADTRRAWSAGRPAIVETHRVNFVHFDRAIEESGLAGLDTYLAQVTADPEEQPTFVTGTEIAQLSNRGTSWCVRGGKILVRNGTRARKIVAVPGWAVSLARGEAAGTSGTESGVLVALGPGSSLDFIP